MIKPKVPQPVAYCWHHGREMSTRDLKKSGCTDPDKQIYGVCKHLMKYGTNESKGARLTMEELYRQIVQTLREHGIRLEGNQMCLVQEMPTGGEMRLWLDEADKSQEVCCK